jgi:L-alanine-DL-glutamate epimerase-like enolase superfamily enzyme
VHFDATVVRVETDEGVTGVGSGDAMVGFAGHESLFVGQDPLALERHYRILANIAFHYGRCWPLDLALWDLAGKILGQPCWRLLGALSDRVPAYASSGSLRDSGAMADRARAYREEGFRAMKIRFHRGDWRDDVRVVKAVRSAVGDDMTLLVDCNQGWRMPWDTALPWTFKDALEVARHLAELGVFWMEEPLHRGDYDGMAALRQAAGVRIAGGEMTRELYEFRTLIERGCLDVLQPDAALVGGITGLRRVALMAQEHNLAFTPHTWTNGVGVLANAHLVAGCVGQPFVEFPYDPPEWSTARRDFMLTEPVKVEGGSIVLSDRPGLGCHLDEDRLAATRL